MLCCLAATNAQPRPVVVELFTSQGCSSCPPADAYVGKLSARSDVLTLSFHVDYWDDLGWRDQFALAQSVERQSIYARNLRRSSVYTHTLEEFNIVRDIRALGPWKGQGQSFHVPRSSLPPDATDVAVLVQPSGQGPIIGAAARTLR
jgi:hypothetical protein